MCAAEFKRMQFNVVDAVLIFSTCQQEGGLTSVVETCLEKGVHVFTMIPTSLELRQMKKCFHIAKAKEVTLFCGGGSRR
jgi:hypothetical protein